MRLLLDTHMVLWALAGSRKLTTSARCVIESADAVYVSAASIWEIAIKARLGKLDADPVEITAQLAPSGFLQLAVTAVHAAGVASLPMHHADPFDRFLIAQALSEPLRLLTADPLMSPYSELVIRV